MAANPGIVGAILAGGTARRMFPQSTGGGDKGLSSVGGRSMLAHVIARLGPQVSTLILNANGDPGRFAAFGLKVVPDLDATAAGPLAGLLAAMTWAKQRGSLAVVTTPADTPFLPDDLVMRLREAAQSKVGVALATSAGQRHPTIGLWPLMLLDDLTASLSRGELSANKFADRHGAIEVTFPMRKIGSMVVDPFFNANTPDDLAAAHAMLTAGNS